MPVRKPRFGFSWDVRATLVNINAWLAANPPGTPPPVFDAVNDIDLVDEINLELDKKANLVAGKIPLSEIPDGALERYLGTAANQTAMLALTGQLGDYCLRTDTNGGGGSVWFLVGSNPALIGSWLESPVGISQAAADARYKLLEVAYQFGGKPAASDEFRYCSGSAKTIYATANLPSGRFHMARVKTAPTTANAVFNIHKAGNVNPQTLGSSLGTITFATNDRIGSVMITSNISLGAGDSLVLVAPSSQDATLADGAITLQGLDS